jgi:membrane protease YdiL (CAAX protease family)
MSEENLMDTQNTRRRIIVFLGLTILFSAIFWVLIIQAGQLSAGQLYILGLMWSPGVAALLTTFIFQRNLRGLGWGRGPLRYLLLSYALPIAYAGVVYGLTWLLGWGAFTTENVPEGQSWPLFVLRNATVIFLLGGFFPALGEEIGWRGLLVPQLAKLTSFTNVAFISGAIWALWHYPLILFADYHASAPRWVALLCFSVLVIGISFAFAWLRLKSGSVWTAAILHASHNIFTQSIFDQLTRDTGFTTYITTEFGIGMAVTAVIVAVMFWRRENALVKQPQGGV